MLGRKQVVLFHCYGGVHRSPAALAACLMAREGFLAHEAIEQILWHRPSLPPCKNRDYILWALRHWEALSSTPSARDAVPKPSVSKKRSYANVHGGPTRGSAEEYPRMGPTENLEANTETSSRRPGARMTLSEPAERDETRGGVLQSDCPAAPHCRRWKRHAGLAAERQLEYLFLYAAHDQRIECLQFYAPHVNVACKSSGKDARAWASAEGTKAVSQDLEAFFAT